MINGELMVVLIVAIVVIGRIIQARHRAQDQSDTGDAPANQENRLLRGEVQTLKERIQVLERVITDTHSSSDLDREIERLRDRT